METDTRILPPHIEETIQSIARLQAAHNEEASSLQRSIDRLTAFIGRPKFMLLITWFVIIWIGLNVGADLSGLPPFDPPTFNWLQGLLAMAAIYMAFTLDSAYQHARGRGGMWKGRAQANVSELR